MKDGDGVDYRNALVAGKFGIAWPGKRLRVT